MSQLLGQAKVALRGGFLNQENMFPRCSDSLVPGGLPKTCRPSSHRARGSAPSGAGAPDPARDAGGVSGGCMSSAA